MHAELAQNVLRVGQHVHQMADRRALIAADIADAALQQRLGDGEDAFAGKFLAGAEPQLLDFLGKGPFGHLQVLLPLPPALAARTFRCRACGCCCSIFCKRGDQRRIFGVVDAVEHRLERVMHGRPGAAELGPALVGQEHLADAAVGVALLAPHQALPLQRVERAAHASTAR